MRYVYLAGVVLGIAIEILPIIGEVYLKSFMDQGRLLIFLITFFPGLIMSAYFAHLVERHWDPPTETAAQAVAEGPLKEKERDETKV